MIDPIDAVAAQLPVHLQHKLKMSRNDCLEQVGDFVLVHVATSLADCRKIVVTHDASERALRVVVPERRQLVPAV